MLGKRPVRVWDGLMWVTVRATKEADRYRVVPDEGKEFEVDATNEQELDDAILKELRAQHR